MKRRGGPRYCYSPHNTTGSRPYEYSPSRLPQCFTIKSALLSSLLRQLTYSISGPLHLPHWFRDGTEAALQQLAESRHFSRVGERVDNITADILLTRLIVSTYTSLIYFSRGWGVNSISCTFKTTLLCLECLLLSLGTQLHPNNSCSIIPH